MTSRPKFRRYFTFSLFLVFFLAGCSSEDQSEEKKGVAEKATAEKVAVEDTGRPFRTDRESAMPEGFEKSYVIAMGFLKDKDYQSARENLMKALGWKSEEQLVLTVPGRRSGSYLPHFYLGQIAYLTGDCKAAMAHWDTSLVQNVIQGTSNYKDLQEGMKKCESGNQ